MKVNGASGAQSLSIISSTNMAAPWAQERVFQPDDHCPFELRSPAARIHQMKVARGASLQDTVTSHLGPPAHSDLEGFACWKDPSYNLYVSEVKVVLTIPFGVTAKACAEAVLWDLLLIKKQLPRQEFLFWKEFGANLARDHVVNIPPASPDDLKKFIRDYCDGRIYCDHQCPSPSLLPMIFFPLALGSFTPRAPEKEEDPSPEWIALQQIPDPGPTPVLLPLPEEPPHPGYPEPPADPSWVELDVATVEELRINGTSTVAVSSIQDLLSMPDNPELQDYISSVEQQNAALRATYDAAFSAYEQKRRDIDEQHQQALARLQKEKRKVERLNRSFAQRLALWSKRKAQKDTAFEGFMAKRYEKFGVLYEYMHCALPRMVNGQPCFMSARILSKEDWDKVRPVIRRELERREEIEI